MNLSPHFTLQELTASEVAARKFIDNTPPPNVLENLKKLAMKLEEVRAALTHPVYINSGYRSPKVNKAVGSKPTSSHVQGLAADIKCHQLTPMQVCEAIIEAGIKFDQLILEYPTPDGGGWTHIGIGSKSRQSVLTINSFGTHRGLHI